MASLRLFFLILYTGSWKFLVISDYIWIRKIFNIFYLFIGSTQFPNSYLFPAIQCLLHLLNSPSDCNKIGVPAKSYISFLMRPSSVLTGIYQLMDVSSVTFTKKWYIAGHKEETLAMISLLGIICYLIHALCPLIYFIAHESNYILLSKHTSNNIDMLTERHVS